MTGSCSPEQGEAGLSGSLHPPHTHPRARGPEALTQDEEHLHGDVADKGVPGRDRDVVIAREADVVGDRDGDVEGGEEDEAIPDGLGDAVVQEEAAGALHGGHLVLRHRWLWLEHVLRGERWWLGTLGGGARGAQAGGGGVGTANTTTRSGRKCRRGFQGPTPDPSSAKAPLRAPFESIMFSGEYFKA